MSDEMENTLPDSEMETLRTCQDCGAVMPASHTGSICPKCVLGMAAAPPTAQLGEQEGDVIGPYTLRQKIGEGGFGVVWMAEQSQPMQRMVALKVVKAGMDTKQVLARFEAEQQALALLDHPNIAKVLDAGATETGRPYFVMELVKGIPITQFCQEQKLATKARLKLFRDVCSAINHAHQKGIIHRDLKPSNVMVTLHGDTPVAKVIDFGIAKATQQKLTDKTLFTRFEQFLGTPVYMSPEQAALSGLDIDTRSDIYSLGVLLYELLAGKPPFDPKTLLSKGYEEMRRIIREEEPPKPSTKLTETQSSADNKFVNVSPAALKGELDWIIMKAIDKDRGRRYETANAFSLDIGRYLENEPVLAAAPSAAYKFRKFASRNKLGFGVAASIAAMLLGGAVVSARQAVQARSSHQLAESRLAQSTVARAEAEKAQEEAEEISGFLTGMFKSADPSSKTGGRSVTVAEILDGATRDLEIKFADKPKQRAQIQESLDRAYRALGTTPKTGNANHFYRLGMVHQQAGRHEDAVTAFRAARKYYTTATASSSGIRAIGANLRLFRSLEELGREEEAEQVKLDSQYVVTELDDVYAPPVVATLVPPDSEWSWLHPTDGVDPASNDPDFHTTFHRLDFDDASWSRGRDSDSESAGFGYGWAGFDGVDIDTPEDVNHAHSAYFRCRFATSTSYEHLELHCRRDDGVIIYLDGKEVGRDNIEVGAEAYTLTTVTRTLGMDSRLLRIRLRDGLQPGEHVLAISLHNGKDPDLRIGGISLVAVRASTDEEHENRWTRFSNLFDGQIFRQEGEISAKNFRFDEALGKFEQLKEAPDAWGIKDNYRYGVMSAYLNDRTRLEALCEELIQSYAQSEDQALRGPIIKLVLSLSHLTDGQKVKSEWMETAHQLATARVMAKGAETNRNYHWYALMLGMAAYVRDDWAASEEWLSVALTRASERNDPGFKALAHAHLAMVWHHKGNAAEAAKDLEKGLINLPSPTNYGPDWWNSLYAYLALRDAWELIKSEDEQSEVLEGWKKKENAARTAATK